MARMGRPPLPEGERGKRVDLYLTAEAQAALAELLGPDMRGRSALVSRLLVEEAKRNRRARAKNRP